MGTFSRGLTPSSLRDKACKSFLQVVIHAERHLSPPLGRLLHLCKDMRPMRTRQRRSRESTTAPETIHSDPQCSPGQYFETVQGRQNVYVFKPHALTQTAHRHFVISSNRGGNDENPIERHE